MNLNLKVSFILFALLFNQAGVKAQFLKDIKKTIKGVKETSKEVTGATNELKKTVKSIKELKQTWQKDTASNIKYNQIPDYRSREEVNISKKQKLYVENGEFKNLFWEPVTKYQNQIFPSFIIGWANYRGTKDEDVGSSLGFFIKTSLPNVVLKWEIECSDKNFFSIDSGYINCDLLRTGNNFMPRISWNYRNLVKHESNEPVNIYFRLTDPNTGSKVEKLVNVNLRSINDCLLGYNGKKFHYLFASYVNEDYLTEIDKISKSMLDTKIIDAVLGYQGGPNYVDLQVAALWRVLHDKGFQYSSITNNSGNSEDNTRIFSQTVRTIDKSLKTSQANCVDGTVLFASILKRLGVKPILVTVPGHCFLGYYTDARDTSLASINFLETTMLSNNSYSSNPKTSVKKFAEKYKSTPDEINKLLKKLIPEGIKLSELNTAYYLEFLDAKIEGDYKYKLNMEKYGAEYVTVLDVSELRTYIKPIPVID